SIPHEITNTPNAVQQSQTPGQKAMEQAAPVSSAAAGVNRHASATQPPIQTSVGQLSRLGSSEHFNPAANLSLNASIRSGGEATGLPANPLREFFHHLGLMHERQIMQRSISPGAAELMQDNRFDNVKSLLMLVSQSPANTVPGSLREAADSLLQQITGQQLMLAQQPSAQIISQIIMQVPLKTEQGEET
ncbi:hypothetical protein MXD81_11595, partial [Microbacteriaceae bacterium K1510]|nr:hypothetical protein [Microbacteriaceae bacterium K1510]